MKIRRVSKVVKGGRNVSFSAMVVVGDYNGKVGAAIGKAAGVPDAIRKGRQSAERSMKQMVLKEGTIPHEAFAKYGSAKVLLLPAAPGTGVIAGGGVRAVIEAAGIQDVLSKTYGGNNAVNTVRATIKALSSLRDPEVEIARRRGTMQNGAPERVDDVDVSAVDAAITDVVEESDEAPSDTPEVVEASEESETDEPVESSEE